MIKLSVQRTAQLIDAMITVRVGIARWASRFEDTSRALIESVCEHEFVEMNWIGHLRCRGCVKIIELDYVDEPLPGTCPEHGALLNGAMYESPARQNAVDPPRMIQATYECKCIRTLQFATPEGMIHG